MFGSPQGQRRSRVPPPVRLAQLVRWCVANTGPGSRLVGTSWGDTTATLEIVELASTDPLTELTQMAAPDHWDVITVVWRRATGGPTGRTSPECDCVRYSIAHCVDRSGRSHSEIEHPDALSDQRTPTPRSTIAALDVACRAMFGLDSCIR